MLGSLLDALTSKISDFLLIQKLNIALQTAKGMAFLESNKVLHRVHSSLVKVIFQDLAARNILFDDADHVKIGDFGLSKIGHDEYTKSEEVIPFRWAAPGSLFTFYFAYRLNRNIKWWYI